MSRISDNVCRRILTALFSIIPASQATATSQDVVAGQVPVGAAEVLSVSGGLVLVIAAILLVSFLYSRLKGPRIGGNSVINIIASQALGSKEQVVLIQIADTQLVLGITTTNVQTLHVFDEPVITAPETTGTSIFADRLKLALSGGRK